jgi:hypothetical protein
VLLLTDSSDLFTLKHKQLSGPADNGLEDLSTLKHKQFSR